MLRSWIGLGLALLVGARAAGAQVTLVPSERSPNQQKFDLQATDLRFLLLPQTPAEFGAGPFRLRFASAALNVLLAAPPTVSYLSVRDGGFVLQVLNLRPREVRPELLGPQAYHVESAAGDTVAHGVLAVIGRAPEALTLAGEEGLRSFELGRAATVRLHLRPHGNYAGVLGVRNGRDFELHGLRELEPDSAGTLTLQAELRALRPGATELRLAVETRDGRVVELVYPELSVRAPAPRRVQVLGGPLYLDATGQGRARLRVPELPRALGAVPVFADDAAGELSVLRQEYDAQRGVLSAEVEFVARAALPAGARELRAVGVRAGGQSFRGWVEVVGAAQVTGVRVEGANPAAVTIGGGGATLYVSGRNLDGLRLDCGALGEAAACRTLSASPAELVASLALTPAAREGELLLGLAAADERRAAALAASPVTLRVRAEFPSIPMPLAGAPFLRLECAVRRGCRAGRDGESLVVGGAGAAAVRLVFDADALPAEHGWQKLLVTVSRLRDGERKPVRSVGTPAAPRLLRHGLPRAELPVLDAAAEARHGDVFVVRVEHAAEQYAPEQRTGLAAVEAFERRVYVDGGAARRLTGDVAVQPILLALSPADSGGARLQPLFLNAGVGATWSFFDARLQPRPYALKLQLLATNLQPPGGDALRAQPTLFLSGNLRIPGTDPARPLVLTAGVARRFGADAAWQLLAGAGLDLGVARLIFGG